MLEHFVPDWQMMLLMFKEVSVLLLLSFWTYSKFHILYFSATGLRIAMMCQAMSTLVCCIAVGFIYNWRLACGGLILMPIVALSTVASSKLYSGQAKADGATAQVSSKIVIEVMNAVRTVVSMHKQQYFFNKFSNSLNEHFM